LVLTSGFFERHPKINAAVFEASSTWLSFLIDERGVTVSYETVRRWCGKFGQSFANVCAGVGPSPATSGT
jgi:hypothetical protein